METFSESRPLIPRNLSLIITAVLVCTIVFMAISPGLFDVDMPSWAVPVMCAVTAVAVAVCFLSYLKVEVDGETLRIFYIVVKVEIPLDQIIASRHGEINHIRNYGGYNLKGIKHKNYAALGEDYGVAMKVKGKRVVSISSARSEELFALLPNREE